MKKGLILAIIGLSVIFVNCRGKDDLLVGTWKEVIFKPEETLTETNEWIFYAGDALIVMTQKKDSNKLDSVTYTYSMTGKNSLTIYGDWDYSPAVGDIRGEYWVDVLKKKSLKMTKRKHPDGSKDGVYIRKEFVKK